MNVISPWCGNEARRPAPPFLSAFLDGVLNWPSGGFLCSGSVLKLFLFVDFNRSLLRFEGSLSFFLKKKGIIIEYLTFLFRKGLNPSLTTPKIEIASLEYSINLLSIDNSDPLRRKSGLQTQQHFATYLCTVRKRWKMCGFSKKIPFHPSWETITLGVSKNFFFAKALSTSVLNWRLQNGKLFLDTWQHSSAKMV